MIVRNSSVKMGQLTQAVVVLSTLLSPFMGTNASPTPHSNIARRGIKFLGKFPRSPNEKLTDMSQQRASCPVVLLPLPVVSRTRSASLTRK
jgi:hypothetical protein